MAFAIRRMDYFYATVKDQPGEAFNLLSLLEGVGVNLLAFTAIPIGPLHTQMALFPEDTLKLESEAARLAWPSMGRIPRCWSKATTNSVRSRVSTSNSFRPMSTYTPPVGLRTGEAVSAT